MWKKKKKKKKNLKKHNFKIPRPHVYPPTTIKMSVKFQKHLLKAVGELCSQGTYFYMHFNSIEAWKKSMWKVKMWQK